MHIQSCCHIDDVEISYIFLFAKKLKCGQIIIMFLSVFLPSGCQTSQILRIDNDKKGI